MIRNTKTASEPPNLLIKYIYIYEKPCRRYYSKSEAIGSSIDPSSPNKDDVTTSFFVRILVVILIPRI
jgi:hypothetical protein